MTVDISVYRPEIGGRAVCAQTDGTHFGASVCPCSWQLPMEPRSVVEVNGLGFLGSGSHGRLCTCGVTQDKSASDRALSRIVVR